MVATKLPDGIDLMDVLKDLLGDEPVEADTDTRAARRDARRERRESSHRISSFDDRDAVVKRRSRSEQARERKQDMKASRANAEINREIEAHEGWDEEKAFEERAGAGRLQYRIGPGGRRWHNPQ